MPTYAYEFNDENAPELSLPPVGFPYGAAQQQLAAAMQRDWTSLATFGTPGSGWPRFTGNSPAWLSLVPPRPQAETNFAAEHHCAFWAAAG